MSSGGVLQIGDEADDRVALDLHHPVVSGTDVAEIARVDDDADVFVLRGDLAQDADGVVARGVVDEDMPVAVTTDFREDFFDLLVALADVFLLVIAAADNGDQPASRGWRGQRDRGDAGGGLFQGVVL